EAMNPVILDVPQIQDTPDTTGYVVGAVISDEGSIIGANLNYSVNGSDFITLPMTRSAKFRYESAIPGQQQETEISYYVEAIDNDGNVTTVPLEGGTSPYTFKVDIIIGTEPIALLPQKFSLLQNYPNPFNPVTEIGYELPEPAYVRLTIYNLLGQELSTIVDNQQDAGFHTATWFGRNNNGMSLASGVYIYKLTARTPTKSFEQVRKMVLLR
ncbi:MAG: T9SS type A sorting domain-containing protein, partial [Candidatus Marinimicrobia bacterium]|nr:T9SS type A sorting domain-containing protein [Candidatus Neomarinimicrobiota bacterium]